MTSVRYTMFNTNGSMTLITSRVGSLSDSFASNLGGPVKVEVYKGDKAIVYLEDGSGQAVNPSFPDYSGPVIVIDRKWVYM